MLSAGRKGQGRRGDPGARSLFSQFWLLPGAEAFCSGNHLVVGSKVVFPHFVISEASLRLIIPWYLTNSGAGAGSVTSVLFPVHVQHFSWLFISCYFSWLFVTLYALRVPQ